MSNTNSCRRWASAAVGYTEWICTGQIQICETAWCEPVAHRDHPRLQLVLQYLPPSFPPSQKIHHPDVSLFCCWLTLTSFSPLFPHLSRSMQRWVSFFFNGPAVSGSICVLHAA